MTAHSDKALATFAAFDTGARRGSFIREGQCPVTFLVDQHRPETIGIGWGIVVGVDVHPELLVRTLKLLGYTITKEA